MANEAAALEAAARVQGEPGELYIAERFPVPASPFGPGDRPVVLRRRFYKTAAGRRVQAWDAFVGTMPMADARAMMDNDAPTQAARGWWERLAQLGQNAWAKAYGVHQSAATTRGVLASITKASCDGWLAAAKAIVEAAGL